MVAASASRRLAGYAVAALFLVVGLSACGGAGSARNCLLGDPFCNSVIHDYELEPSPFFDSPSAPIPVGSSIDISFHERPCTTSSSESPGAPGGCGAWFVPGQLVGNTRDLSNKSTPCPMTITQVARGTLRFTRTAPGDPILFAGTGNANGYCAVDVHDPIVTSQFQIQIYL